VSYLGVQGPLIHDGMLRFYERDRVITSIPEGRIFYVTGRGNCEFSTDVFKMPSGGLTLDANILYRPSDGKSGRAYVMAELRDEAGSILSGYERGRCLLEDIDGRSLLLTWDGRTGKELAGQAVQIRFLFRDAKLYSMSARL